MNNEKNIELSAEAIRLLNQLGSLIVYNQKQINNISVLDWSIKDIKLNQSKLSASSLRSIQTAFRHLINFFRADTQLNDITKEQVVEFRSYLFSKVSNLVYWRTYRASLNRAVEYGYLTTNHFNTVKPPKKQKTKPKNMSRKELEKTFPYLNNAIKDLVLFTYLTGLRLAEVVYLQFSDVDLINMTTTIGSENFRTKTRNYRTIPLSVEAIEILRKRLPKILSVNNRNYVFTKSDKKPFTKDHVSKIFKRAIRKAGLSEHLTFHSLRHSAISNLMKSGAAPSVVQKIAGHNNLSTTLIYTHIDLEDMRKAINKLNNNYSKINEV